MTLEKIDEKVSKAIQQLTVQFNVLDTLLLTSNGEKLAPKFICFLPSDKATSKDWLKKITTFNPERLFKTKVRVFFIDPIRFKLAPTNTSNEYPKGKGFGLKI